MDVYTIKPTMARGSSDFMPIELSIGQLAATSGCKVQTIRYYEQIGLIDEPPRTAGQQRRYPPAAAERLIFIRHSRRLGFSLEAIRELLSLTEQPFHSCADADRIARRQLAQVEQNIAQLEALRQELKRMIKQCKGDKIADCRVIEVLADHAQCVTDSH